MARARTPGTARMFCDIHLPDGSPSLADPRHVLKRALAKAADLGFTFYTHPEIEFFLLKQGFEPGQPPVPVDQAGYFDHVPHGTAHDFRRAAITMLESMGISVEFSHHEGAPGPERDRPAVRRRADHRGQHHDVPHGRSRRSRSSRASTRPSCPSRSRSTRARACTRTCSLFEGDRNAFHEAGAPYQLSKIGRQFIAGLLRHAAEITAVTNQWVNSYKRLWGGGEAPAYVCWGHNNRSALVRVPMYKPGKGQSTRVEFRSLDSACNPYLAFAVMLAAGLKGIEEGYELPDEAEDDVWSLTDAERRAMGIEPLPTNLVRGDPADGGERARRRDARRARLRLRPAQQAGRVAGVPRAGHAVRAGALPAGAVGRACE